MPRAWVPQPNSLVLRWPNAAARNDKWILFADGEPEERCHVRVIGLVGGVASGKSLIARQLVELGAGWLDADRAGHEVLELEDVKQALRQRFGEEVVGPDGQISRPAIGQRVFGGAGAVEARQFLEQTTHPRIGELLGRQAAAFEAAGKEVLVLDAPLLMEAGWDKFCDKTVFVEAPREVRLDRARGRGWSDAEFAARGRATVFGREAQSAPTWPSTIPERRKPLASKSSVSGIRSSADKLHVANTPSRLPRLSTNP